MDKQKTRHTPGPWTVAGRSSNDGEAYIIEAGGRLTPNERTVAWTANTLVNLPDGEYGEETTAEDRANSALIAKAPELLDENNRLRAALRCLLEDHKRMFPKCHPMSTIDWEGCIEVVQARAALKE